MHPELEKLIDLALVDGKISSQEMKVILNKAEHLGITSDELDIILEARKYYTGQNQGKVNFDSGNKSLFSITKKFVESLDNEPNEDFTEKVRAKKVGNRSNNSSMFMPFQKPGKLITRITNNAKDTSDSISDIGCTGCLGCFWMILLSVTFFSVLLIVVLI
jgi:hypothetical protein